MYGYSGYPERETNLKMSELPILCEGTFTTKDLVFFSVYRAHQPIYNVFLWIAAAPTSSYSALPTHMVLKAAKLAKIDPPDHVINFLLGGAEMRIFTSVQFDACANRLTSFNKRSPYPENMVEPPASTICENKVFRRSRSVLKIALARHS